MLRKRQGYWQEGIIIQGELVLLQTNTVCLQVYISYVRTKESQPRPKMYFLKKCWIKICNLMVPDNPMNPPTWFEVGSTGEGWDRRGIGPERDGTGEGWDRRGIGLMYSLRKLLLEKFTISELNFIFFYLVKIFSVLKFVLS